MTEQEFIARVLKMEFLYDAETNRFIGSRAFLHSMRDKKLRPQVRARGTGFDIAWVADSKPIVVPEVQYASVPNADQPVKIVSMRSTQVAHSEYKEWSITELLGKATKLGYVEQPYPNGGVRRMRILNFLKHKEKK